MRTTIQQLEDLKEWSQDSTRYERRLAFRKQSMPGGMGTEAGTIPIEWDELSDREIEYYRTGPWSTREDYSKGQLVQPGPGRQGYKGSKSNKARDLRSQRYIGQVTTQDEKFIKKAEQILKKNVETKNGVKVFRLEKEPKKGIGLVDVVMKEGKLQNYGKVSFLINDIAEKNGWLTPKDYRRYLVVDSFMKDYGLNDQFTGEGKFNKRLKEFWNPKLPDRYKGINKTFKEWAQGDFEVPGFDRSKFNSLLKKNLENWKPVRVNEKAAQTAKELKWLHEINTKHPDWTAKRVQNAFNNKFKNLEYWTDTNFDNRALHLYGILVHGENRTGRATDLSKGDRAPWLKKTLSKNMGGNYQRFLVEADRYEAKGNVQMAKKLRKAAKDLFGSTGELRKAGGHAEHPWFWNYGGVKGMFQIDSLVQGDLNNFKFNNFEGPIQDLIDKYESAGDSLKPGQKKAILAEIDLRRNFLNTMTDIGDGGMARHVTFDSTSAPGKIKVINKTPDIYGVHKAGKLDPLELKTRGGWYRDALIKNLTDRDVNILKKDETIKIAKIGATRMNEIFQKAGIGGHCKAYGGRVGFAEAGAVNMSKCMTQAIEDNKKAMNSTDESVRAAAIFKNRQAVNNAKKIPAIAKLIRQGVQRGKSSLGWLLGGWNIPLEAIVEGGIYEYYRREGYTHDQAFAETFTPRLLTEGAEARSTDKVPWYGGAEQLLEDDLIDLKGTQPHTETLYNMAAKEQIDNLAALGEVTSEYYKTKDHLTAIQSGRKAVDPETVERLQIRLKELEAEGIRLDRLTKEGTSGSEALRTAQEKLDTEQGQRAIEYGEYGQGDTPELARRREEERYRLMDEKFPGYGKAQIDQKLEDDFYSYINPAFRSYKGQTVQNPQGLRYIPGVSYDRASDYYKDKDKMAYFAENFRTEKAGGGIAGIRRPWAIPPESGPDPQGLASMNNYVTKRTG
jgi:hypothetical protein